MNLYSPRTIRQLNEKYGFRFSKSLGQNFLTDPAVPETMVRDSRVGEQDLVIEIGPGIGALTAAAAQEAGRVVAIEIDRRLLPILDETLAEYDNVEIINGDVLEMDLNTLIQEQREAHDLTGKVRIIGNLPYYITTPILMKLLEEHLPAESITVMMQKEVADRIEAAPGSRTRGAISVAIQYYCVCRRIMNVPKGSFIPSPKVDSAVLYLQLREEKAAQILDEKRFFDCVRAGFEQRRKTLSNALSGAGKIPKETVREVLEAAGIEENRRAETLSIEEFAKIANELTSKENTDAKE